MKDTVLLACNVIAKAKHFPVGEVIWHIENMERKNDALLTKKEVASRLNVSSQTVERLIKNGKLKKITLSPQLVRISSLSVDNYLAGLK